MKETQVQKVHLDTDLGGDTDDLCALAMLLRWPNIRITGITTNTENDAKRAGYTKYVLKLAERRDVPVKAGADVSGGYYRGKPGLPKEEDFWPEPIAPSPNPLDEALDLLKSSIEQEARVIGIGTFTNFRLLDQKYSGILNKAKLYLMGGYVYPVRDGFPQWGNKMDWNIQADVNSAKYVLENSSPTLIPLTVSVETAIRRSYLPALRASGKLGELLARQAEAHNREYNNEERIGRTCSNLPADILNFQHDALACAIALGWNDGVEIEELPLTFEVQESYLHERLAKFGKPTKVVKKIDGEKFSEFWFHLLTDRTLQTLP